jgi:hypothetical protein
LVSQGAAWRTLYDRLTALGGRQLERELVEALQALAERLGGR